MKIFRGEEEILLEKIEAKSKRRLSEDEDNLKLGEIRIKDSKYFYKPNLREQLNMSNFDKSENSSVIESDNLSWLVYKGQKIPFYKKNYRIKEGDIIKLGREWLLIKDIHISNYTRRKLKNNNKEKTNDNAGIFLSYHSQTNQSLNLNGDFNNFGDENTDEEKDNDDSDKDDKKLNATENNNVNTRRLFKKNKEKDVIYLLVFVKELLKIKRKKKKKMMDLK